MRTALSVTLSAFFLLPAASFADPCADVVADTIAEMRAGADGWWSDDIANLVRASAGSACIKAQSGRYGATHHSTVEEMDVSSAGQGSNQSDKADQAAATEAVQEDDDSWSVGGLTFRSMSGSPTQKPYERQRQSKKEEE